MTTDGAKAASCRFTGGDFLLWSAAALLVLGVHGGAAAFLLSQTEPPASDATQAAIMIEMAPEPEAVETGEEEIAPDSEDAEAVESPVIETPPLPALDSLAEPPPDLAPPDPVPPQEAMADPVPVEEALIEEPPVEPLPEPEPEPVEEEVAEEIEPVEEFLPEVPAEVAVPLPMARPKPPQPEKKVAEKKPPPAASKAARKASADVAKAERTAATQTSTGGTASSVSPARWQSTLFSHLQRYKRYPGESRSRREEGTASVRFRIDDRGRVLSVAIARSSGHAALDHAVLDMVRRASPVPPPPPGVNLTLVVPVRFDIR